MSIYHVWQDGSQNYSPPVSMHDRSQFYFDLKGQYENGHGGQPPVGFTLHKDHTILRLTQQAKGEFFMSYLERSDFLI